VAENFFVLSLKTGYRNANLILSLCPIYVFREVSVIRILTTFFKYAGYTCNFGVMTPGHRAGTYLWIVVWTVKHTGILPVIQPILSTLVCDITTCFKTY
jgi:hypothetical protein